jgi:hypothetical protein
MPKIYYEDGILELFQHIFLIDSICNQINRTKIRPSPMQHFAPTIGRKHL